MKLKVSPTVPAVSKTQSMMDCSQSADPVVPGSLMVKVNTQSESKPKDPRLMTGLLTVAVPNCNAMAASPASPSPKALARSTSKPDEKPKDLDERIKSFNEQYERWSGSVRVSGSGSGRNESGRFNIDIRPNQPSAIVQKLLSRKSVLDDDSKRLENLKDAPAEEKPDDSPGPAFKQMGVPDVKPGGDMPLDTPLPGPVGQFSNFPPVQREIPPVPPVATTVMSTVQSSNSTRVSAPTKPQSAGRSPAPQSPSAPVSPRGSTTLPNRLYFPPLPVKPVELPARPPAVEEFSSPKQLASRPLPLPNKAGTAATSATVPIKPLIDKLGKPAAFTKPSATVTPTLKSTGMTASTVRPSLSTTSSTKTVSTCSMVPTTKLNNVPAVEKGEASSTTCSPKLDTSNPTAPSEIVVATVQETDSDPNVTSTTKEPSVEAKKKLDTPIAKDPIKVIKKEIDVLSFREKKEIKEELLFAPTLIQTKPKLEKLSKKFDIIDTIGKDGKKSKDSSYTSLHKDKLKSSKDSQKHKQKLKHKNDLKDFLSATATIRKESSAKKEEKKTPPVDKEEPKKLPDEKKRRLSSNSEVEEADQPKPKVAKLVQDSEAEPEAKKHRSDSTSKLSMGRIPKLEKPEKSEKSEHKSESKKDEAKKDGGSSSSKHKHVSSSSSKSKSKHDSEKRHKSDKDRDKDRKKQKSSKHDQDRSSHEKERRHEKSKSLSFSTDDEKVKREKEMKKAKESKKKEEKDKKDSDREKDKDKKDREHRSKDSKDKSRDRDKEKERAKEKEKERERKERKRKKEEERKKSEAQHVKKKKKLDHESSSDEEGTSDDSKPKFSIFDEPVFDPNNPIYFSMYDKVRFHHHYHKVIDLKNFLTLIRQKKSIESSNFAYFLTWKKRFKIEPWFQKLRFFVE